MHTRRVLTALFLCLTLLCSTWSLALAENAATASASATGLDETVTVTLTVENGVITAAEATTDREDAGIGQLALDQLSAAIVEQNTVNVDAVAGATVTSNAVIAAATEAYLGLTGTALNLDAWAKGAGYVKAEDYNMIASTDAVTSATVSGVGGINFGDIDLSDSLKQELILEYLKGAEGNYREMYQIATAYNNIPTIGSVEYVLDPTDMTLFGSSETNTAKLNNMLLNPSVDLYWTRQIRPGDVCSEAMPVTPTYFMSYGVQITGTFHALRWSEMSEEELSVYLPKARTYFVTLGAQYAAYADMDDASLLAFLANSMGNYYVIIPSRFVVTSPWFLNVYNTGYAQQFVSADVIADLTEAVTAVYPEATSLTTLDFQTFSATGLKTQQVLTFDR